MDSQELFKNRVQVLLYRLMRDDVSVGTVMRIVSELECFETFTYTSKGLEHVAHEAVERLTAPVKLWPVKVAEGGSKGDTHSHA